MSRKYTAQDMRETADDFENYSDMDESVISEMLRQAADDLEREEKREKDEALQREEKREKDEALQRAAIRTPERNFDRFAHMTAKNPVGDISAAFSSYIEENFPPNLRYCVCMDRVYYDFLLWLFRATAKKGVAKCTS